MRIPPCVIVAFLFVRTGLSQTDKYTDENRPYKFGFNIEGYQHRQEEKDEKGLIKGEYGFITADGYYRVTVYATDENGDFRIISMKNYYVGFPPEDPQTTPQPATQFGAGRQPSGRGGLEPGAVPLSAPGGGRTDGGSGRQDPVQLTGLTACSDCLIPTTKKPGVGTRFGGGGNSGFGSRTGGGGGQGFGGGSRGDGPVFGTRAGGAGTGFGGSGGEQGGPRGGLGGSGGSRGGLGGSEGLQGGFGESGGPQGGLGGSGTPPGGRGIARFPGSAGGGGGSTGGRGNGGGGRFESASPNRGAAGGNAGTSPADRLPEVGTVRDGLPRGVTMDDIKALLYTFNYTVGFHGHHEDGYRNGDKEGDYFFDGRDGVERKVEYVANEFGYQPNITFIDLPENDLRRPKEETEKEYGLKGYEFKWFYRK